jgi:hypothetical protein
MQLRGPGDYLVAGPTLTIIDKAAGPEIEHAFQNLFKLGYVRTGPWQFIFTPDGATHRRAHRGDGFQHVLDVI